MNKPKLLGLLFTLLICNVTFGQYNNFDLTQYKLPDIKTSRLDINANLNNEYNKETSTLTSPFQTDERNNITSGFVDITYNKFRNSTKYQGTLTINGGIDPNINKTVDGESITKDVLINSSTYVYSENRFYLDGLKFIEVDPYASFNSRIKRERDNESTPDLTSKQSSNSIHISLPFAFGYGRIEPVEDARLAVYILDELTKAGRITGIQSDDRIIEMAGEISKIKNKRFFDSRIKKISELQVIDSFLVANNMVSVNDINYFSILNDNWDYSSGPQRESGLMASIGIDNDVVMGKNMLDMAGPIEISEAESSREYMVGGFLNFSYAKPINLYWQTSAYIQPYYNFSFYRDPKDLSSDLTNYNQKALGGNLGGSIQYLPNSRTSFKYTINGGVSNVNNEMGIEDPDTYSKYKRLSANQIIDIYYYVSPRLRVQLNSVISINRMRYLTGYISNPATEDYYRHYFDSNLSVKLIYSIF